MAEPCVLPEAVTNIPAKPWALTGKTEDRDAHIIASLKLGKDDAYLNRHVKSLAENYADIAKNETMYEEYMCNDADYVIVAYGTSARVCKKAVKVLREQGIKAGLFRPITLWPFPEDAIEAACKNAKKLLTGEMSKGQMVQEVRLYCGKTKKEIDLNGGTGGLWSKFECY